METIYSISTVSTKARINLKISDTETCLNQGLIVHKSESLDNQVKRQKDKNTSGKTEDYIDD